MPFYPSIKRYSKKDRSRTVDSLQRLRAKLTREIPPRDIEDNLLLATWNLRDFDSNKFGHGPRLKESFHYIAEVISRFDIVALQEVNDDLGPLKRVMSLLGPWWDYITTDVTAGRGGNNERGTIVYDRRKVRFDKIAGEIVLPDRLLVGGEKQFARTPYVVSFKAGWFSFSLCTVHLYYGAASGAALDRRVDEIGKIADFLAKRAKAEDSNMILLGDFNIVSPEHKTMKALLDSGFHVPDNLRHPTNAMRNKYYDQIAFRVREDELQLSKYQSHDSSGVFEFFRSVFRTADWEDYFKVVKADSTRDQEQWKKDRNGDPTDDNGKKRYYSRNWRTFQMSDHLPLWVALKINFTDEYLDELEA